MRIIDLFVDSLSIKDYGFRTDFIENGRPAYHPADLLKLFIYGYMNKVRYSLDLKDDDNKQLLQDEIRKQPERKEKYEVAYNVQSTVDAKNSIPNQWIMV